MAAISPNTPPLAPREGEGQNTKLATVASTPGGLPGDGGRGQGGRRMGGRLVQGCRGGRVAGWQARLSLRPKGLDARARGQDWGAAPHGGAIKYPLHCQVPANFQCAGAA